MKIRNQILRLIAVHVSLIVICVLAISSYAFTKNELANVYENARNLGHTVADQLDGDALETYAKTLKKDEA